MLIGTHFQSLNDMLPVWTWECDLNGLYTACSPEIFQCLGIEPEKIIGQSIYSVLINPETISVLNEVIVYGKFPNEIKARFQSGSGQWVNGKINIFELKEKTGRIKGWHGFNQVILEEQPAATKPDETTGQPADASLPTQPLHSENGIAIINGKIEPAGAFWSESSTLALFNKNSQVSEKPACLSVPFPFGSFGTGVIELLVPDGCPAWNPQQIHLVEEIALQLGNTVERLLLKAILEKEIKDRSRAEDEILRRNQELVKIHEIGQQLSLMSDPGQVFEYIYTSIAEMIDNRNMTITLFDKDQKAVFPLVSQYGEVKVITSDPFMASILEYVTREKSPLLVTGESPSEFVSRQISKPQVYPSCLIAVPMLAGDRPVGAIILQNFEDEKAYNFLHLQLLSTIATQITAALENVHLFQEIRNALTAIEIRERYQAKVALAVTSLSQNGTKSLSTVLRLLGQAALCSRVVYIRRNKEDENSRWKNIQTWLDPDIDRLMIAGEMGNPKIDYNACLQASPDHERPSGKTWITSPLVVSAKGAISARPEAGNILFLQVPGSPTESGYLAFEQFDQERVWEDEEIRVLQLAADALSNTVIREGLMVQLQLSLTETESLYNASHQLALENEPDDMLAALSINFSQPHLSRTILVIFKDQENSPEKQLHTAAVWLNESKRLSDPDLLESFPQYLLPVFTRQTAVFFDDVSRAELDEEKQTYFLQNDCRALGIIPLLAGKRQLGVLLLCAGQPYRFSNREKRIYPPLVDQMANAIENAHAYELAKQAVKEMKEVDRLKSRFLATMTHELRSPLNAIIGFSQVIYKGIDGPVNDTQQQDLLAIYDSGQLLLNLINDVLDLSKIEAGKMDLFFSSFNLEDIIDACMATTRGLIKNKNIQLEKEISAPLPVVEADPTRIRQVLTNLLSNAAKFTDSGAIKVKAVYGHDGPSGAQEITVFVSDTGIGITPENQKKIFQPFTQVDSLHATQAAGGTGLGLSISRLLVEMHHGRIGLQHSTPYQGSSFYFTLPVKQPQD